MGDPYVSSLARDPEVTGPRLKILHLITGLERGGAEIMLARLVARMDNSRFENVVVSLTNDGPMGEVMRQGGVRTEMIGMSRSLPTPGAFARLYHLIRDEQPAVLQTWLYHSDLLGLAAGRLAKVPAIAWNIRCSEMDGHYTRGVNGMLIKLLAWLSGWPGAIIANSQAGQQFHIRLGYRPKRWLVLENGFDLEVLRPDAEAGHALRNELGVPTTDRLIGLVARYDPVKDHETFLRAAAGILADTPNVRFVLAGAGVDDANPHLVTLIDNLGIADKLHLLGPRDDIPRLTAGFDIATCCSRSEGFPNVVGEAMACGVPCVVTDVGDAARIVDDCGVVVAPGDSVALAQGWRSLLAMDSANFQDLGRRAANQIKNCYSMTRCIERYEDFYRGLATTRD